MNRKGIIDAAIIPIYLLIGALLLVVLSVLSIGVTSVVSELRDEGDLDAEIAGRLESGFGHIPTISETVFVLGLLGLALALIGLSFFTPTHPVFAFTVLAVIIGGSYMGVYVSNTWDEMYTSSEGALRQALDGQPIMRNTMSNIPYFFLAVAGLSSIAFYAGSQKKKAEGGGFG